jgi:hypothetical protein
MDNKHPVTKRISRSRIMPALAVLIIAMAFALAGCTLPKTGGGSSPVKSGPALPDKNAADIEAVDAEALPEYDGHHYVTVNGNVPEFPEEMLSRGDDPYEYYGDLRTVDVAMRRLREKLEDDPANPKYFITKRGAGYYLQK